MVSPYPYAQTVNTAYSSSDRCERTKFDYPRWPDSKDPFLLDILPGREDNSFTSRLRRAVPTEGEGSAAPREAMDIQWSSGIQIPLSLEFQFPCSLPVTLFAGVVI